MEIIFIDVTDILIGSANASWWKFQEMPNYENFRKLLQERTSSSNTMCLVMWYLKFQEEMIKTSVLMIKKTFDEAGCYYVAVNYQEGMEGFPQFLYLVTFSQGSHCETNIINIPPMIMMMMMTTTMMIIMMVMVMVMIFAGTGPKKGWQSQIFWAMPPQCSHDPIVLPLAKMRTMMIMIVINMMMMGEGGLMGISIGSI